MDKYSHLDFDELTESRRPVRETVLEDPARANAFLKNIRLALLACVVVALGAWLATQAITGLVDRVKTELAITPEQAIALIDDQS